jgi:apolipoprotein N-acyltransferase
MWNALQNIVPRSERGQRWVLVLLTAASLFLAFVPFELAFLVWLWPLPFHLLLLRCRSWKEGLLWGLAVSWVAHLVGFYWVTYVAHVFGGMPWIVAGLLCLGFCTIASVNLPIYGALLAGLFRRYPLETLATVPRSWLFVLGLPALFTVCEYLAPKLFPFYFGHVFFVVPLLMQVSELTGAIVLSFASYAVGGALTLAWLGRTRGLPWSKRAVAFPVALWVAIAGFGAWRFANPPDMSRPFTVTMVQANIGSLIKVAARGGLQSRVDFVMDRYRALTETALAGPKKPDLILWPETAVPFPLNRPTLRQRELVRQVAAWNVPLVTGGYALNDSPDGPDYNAAFLFTPDPSDPSGVSTQIYRKQILLAFGEYFPGGETFPVFYRWFRHVSRFGRGTSQEPFVLADGTKVGITVCYEAIVPRFYRETARRGPVAVLNLTNDSWFGDTSEPRHHGALASFRAVETRMPLFRVTNTGITFAVDALGRWSDTTPTGAEAALTVEMGLPQTSPTTVYLRYGDWFVALCAGLAVFFVALLERRRRTVV